MLRAQEEVLPCAAPEVDRASMLNCEDRQVLAVRAVIRLQDCLLQLRPNFHLELAFLQGSSSRPLHVPRIRKLTHLFTVGVHVGV